MIARAVKQNFDQEADVDIWNENIFAANRGYLETLLNRASYYDYCIAVFAPDDKATVRGKKVNLPRNNVIFEFGLFLGRLGPNRAFFIAQEGTELFSDWKGIEVATFKPRDNLVAAVGGACQRIREEMAVAEKLEHFTMLPSTSLAIGYYHNFLRRVFEAFEFSDSFTVVTRDDRGNIVKETTHKIVNRRPTIHVLLPAKLEDLESNRLKERTAAYKQVAVCTKFREFPFYIHGDITKDAKNITFFDIPTTMLSSRIAIQRNFSPDFLARGDTASHLEKREIANFERTLRLMVPNEIENKYFEFSILKGFIADLPPSDCRPFATSYACA